MKPLGLGEHGGISITREAGGYVAYVRYRTYAGKGRRIKRRGRSKADASRNVLKALREALGADSDGEFTSRSTLEEAARGWLRMFEGLVERGARSPSTLDEYRCVLARVILPEPARCVSARSRPPGWTGSSRQCSPNADMRPRS